MLLYFSFQPKFRDILPKIMNTLIGYTGFVGSQLDRDREFDHRYRSTDIDLINGRGYDHVVCAGVQAVKWWANQNPEEDWAGIEKLLKALETVHAERFTLISTIDVFNPPRGVNEQSEIEREGHHVYGLHRLMIEEWVTDRFPNVAILRLPGLFGPGLKKNVIFDMMNNHIALRRLEYDLSTVPAKILAAGLPNKVAARLASGR